MDYAPTTTTITTTGAARSMDVHLTTIGSTLDAIARLQADAPSSSRGVYRPFTSAVLNTYKLDVLDYIRDADQVESNLFWCPPPAGAGSGGKGEQEAVEEGITVGVASRLPEPKEFVPPTPLRTNAIEAEAKGLVQFDARTLLKAAQTLLNNYHHAPRARKHIKTLLKRHSELEKQTMQYETALMDTESLVSRLSHPEHAKELVASSANKSTDVLGSDEEIRTLQESIRREQMEILAVEQTTEDLLEKRQRLLLQKASAGKRQPLKQVDKTLSSSSTPTQSTSATPKASAPPVKRSSAGKDAHAKAPEAKQAAAPYAPPAGVDEGHREEEEEQDEDLTVGRLPSDEEAHPTHTEERESEPATGNVEPESSDELERICENVWSLFGDNLRYVAVEREAADYGETLRILQDLSMGGASGGGEGDSSMVSSSSGSQATAATSGSTSSSLGQLDNAGPPSPTVAIAAHVLYALLTTPSPHIMDFDLLKAEGESWWNQHGQEALRASAAGREAPDMSDSSGSLANKAVYSLIAKKLLRLQFRGARRIISFPAHLG